MTDHPIVAFCKIKERARSHTEEDIERKETSQKCRDLKERILDDMQRHSIPVMSLSNGQTVRVMPPRKRAPPIKTSEEALEIVRKQYEALDSYPMATWPFVLATNIRSYIESCKKEAGSYRLLISSKSHELPRTHVPMRTSQLADAFVDAQRVAHQCRTMRTSERRELKAVEAGVVDHMQRHDGPVAVRIRDENKSDSIVRLELATRKPRAKSITPRSIVQTVDNIAVTCVNGARDKKEFCARLDAELKLAFDDLLRPAEGSTYVKVSRSTKPVS